jgi:prepilin-type N-terminal cleavage/methylation domain-containing protein
MTMLKNSKGFTLVEMLMVFIVLAALAQVGLVYYLDIRTRSSDVIAVSDGRNLATVVRNNFINLDDVKYDHNPGDGDEIGSVDTSNNSRPSVFTLSPGVRARIVAGSESPGVPEAGYFEAYLFHISGTKDSLSPSGYREFYYVADEASELYTLATF